MIRITRGKTDSLVSRFRKARRTVCVLDTTTLENQHDTAEDDSAAKQSEIGKEEYMPRLVAPVK